MRLVTSGEAFQLSATVFADDTNYLRATARRIRAIAASGFEWLDKYKQSEHPAADTHVEEARKQMLAIALGYDRLAKRTEEHSEPPSDGKES
jgi:hypothetical protein